MDNAQLPDLRELRSGRKRNKRLPPQTSPQDTSNWNDRAFTVPDIEIDREIIFDHPTVEFTEVVANPLLEQERVRTTIRAKKKNK